MFRPYRAVAVLRSFSTNMLPYGARSSHPHIDSWYIIASCFSVHNLKPNIRPFIILPPHSSVHQSIGTLSPHSQFNIPSCHYSTSSLQDDKPESVSSLPTA